MKVSANNGRPIQVGIVGPCTAGKSTLIKGLSGRLTGEVKVELRHKAQEHSYVQTMWQQINPPDQLIFLDVSYPVSMQRRKFNWTLEEYQEQQRRLTHAREHADFYIMTDELSPEQVAEQVASFLAQFGLALADNT